MIIKFIRWFFNLFDNRSDYEKMKEVELYETIDKLFKEYHVRIGPRGGLSKIKKENISD
jgi:hypothetical protein